MTKPTMNEAEDWSAHDNYPKSYCECMNGHPFYSHSKFSGRRVLIISREPCPKCGTDQLRKTSSEFEPMTLTKSDVKNL
jgi:hypothetical protein